jgi:splicing factor 3A subunit 3
VFDAHLKSKNHLKKQTALDSGKGQTNGHGDGAAHASTSSTPSMAVNEKARSMALMEHQIRYFVSDYDSPLLVIRNDTKANVERKQALTDKERQIENEELEERERREAEEVALKSDKQVKKNFRIDDNDEDMHNGEDDEEERIYNPLKLPLGWDGKPIPFWLYKLHGLGVEYSCEICSNFTYRGRKNFERHFQEARHAFGMRALGLPNTKHFHEITKIADAVARELMHRRFYLCERIYTDSSPSFYDGFYIVAFAQ